MTMYKPLAFRVEATTKYDDEAFDGVVLVTDKIDNLPSTLDCLKTTLQELKQFDSAVEKDVVVTKLNGESIRPLVFAPTGPLNRDYDDIRRFGEAAGDGFKRALKAGCRSPLLVCPGHPSYGNSVLVSALGALSVLYVPLELREDVPSKASKADKMGLWVEDDKEGKKIVEQASSIESGRIVYRDIGGSDPERMTPQKAVTYVKDLFKGSCVKVNIIFNEATLEKEYPLHAAVNRCASHIDRHKGKIIELEYVGEGEIKETLMIVGKGVTYDTGGADVKTGGAMAGMHRDKCGAAATAGFFRILSLLKPKNIKVCGVMTMVRNSVGADSYVADEIITSRAGVRVRIGNTDAEGRMAMADPLCKMKDQAKDEINPHIYTIATLTGHAIRTAGAAYSIVLDNGPARNANHAESLQSAGHDIADPFEISTIRREDFAFHEGKTEAEDILQAGTQPSSATARGHQSPAAFMIMVSGLDKHGIDSSQPLPYSHLDIAGSSGLYPDAQVPTGAPIVAMTAKYILPRI